MLRVSSAGMGGAVALVVCVLLLSGAAHCNEVDFSAENFFRGYTCTADAAASALALQRREMESQGEALMQHQEMERQCEHAFVEPRIRLYVLLQMRHYHHHRVS